MDGLTPTTNTNNEEKSTPPEDLPGSTPSIKNSLEPSHKAEYQSPPQKKIIIGAIIVGLVILIIVLLAAGLVSFLQTRANPVKRGFQPVLLTTPHPSPSTIILVSPTPIRPYPSPSTTKFGSPTPKPPTPVPSPYPL